MVLEHSPVFVDLAHPSCDARDVSRAHSFGDMIPTNDKATWFASFYMFISAIFTYR